MTSFALAERLLHFLRKSSHDLTCTTLDSNATDKDIQEISRIPRLQLGKTHWEYWFQYIYHPRYVVVKSEVSHFALILKQNDPVALFEWEPRKQDHVYLCLFEILEEYRGAGYGEIVFGVYLQALVACGMTKLTFSSTKTASGFYRSFLTKINVHYTIDTSRDEDSFEVDLLSLSLL